MATRTTMHDLAQHAGAVVPAPLRELVGQVRDRHRAAPDARMILGFTGPPGCGKSTVVDRLAAALGEDLCRVVPMDGFHLAARQIAGTPLEARRGAIDTFDAAGYLHLLQRLRARDEPVVYAPVYERSIEDPIAGAIAVPAATPIVLTEGNYLLADAAPWNGIRDVLDGTWYIETPDEARLERLIERHHAFGKTAEAARAWATGPDEANAAFIASTRSRADRVLRWT